MTLVMFALTITVYKIFEVEICMNLTTTFRIGQDRMLIDWLIALRHKWLYSGINGYYKACWLLKELIHNTVDDDDDDDDDNDDDDDDDDDDDL